MGRSAPTFFHLQGVFKTNQLSRIDNRQQIFDLPFDSRFEAGVGLQFHQQRTIADLLIVGDDIEPRRLRNFLKSLEVEVGKEIKFAVMDKDEFKYRLAMFDRFVRVLMEAPHEKLINRLGI